MHSELAAYHATCQMSPAAATYLISGEVRPPRPTRNHGENEDIDMDHEEEEIESDEEVPHVKNVLVGEGGLEGATSWTFALMIVDIMSSRKATIYSRSFCIRVQPLTITAEGKDTYYKLS